MSAWLAFTSYYHGIIPRGNRLETFTKVGARAIENRIFHASIRQASDVVRGRRLKITSDNDVFFQFIRVDRHELAA